ncbi:MAG TPA: hypothetical protein PK805_00665 [Acidovorax temperans]|jgi:hypothetical protein|nr:hypothetical protein [Acidovorax temperans]
MTENSERTSQESDNYVMSFETGIMAREGEWVGICIKFATYDHRTKLTHWPPLAYALLMRSMADYCNHLGSNAFMLRAKADPSLVESLPAMHPYHTLLTEIPNLTEDEIGRAGRATVVERATYTVTGTALELRAVFGDGRTESIFLHEYTALSLFGYLQEYLEAADILTGPAAGSA